MATILMLGGTAWLGREVSRQAVEDGHDVTCLARGESGDVIDGARFVRADRSDREAYAEVQQDWDVVVDVTRQPGHARSAVRGLGGRVGHWTFVSSGNAYADLSAPLDEQSPVREPLADDIAASDLYGEAKVACEDVVRGLPAHLVLRVGLLAGPGDESDRAGYWVCRFARAGDEPVLVPDLPDAPAQVLDVRDLAAFVLDASLRGVTGVMNAAGDPLTIPDLLAVSAEVAGHRGSTVAVDTAWAERHDVSPWAGDRSFPLWLPAGFEGMCRMATDLSDAAGLRRRPLRETLTDVLDDERRRGLDRPRRAGLTREDEVALLERV